MKHDSFQADSRSEKGGTWMLQQLCMQFLTLMVVVVVQAKAHRHSDR